VRPIQGKCKSEEKIYQHLIVPSVLSSRLYLPSSMATVVIEIELEFEGLVLNLEEILLIRNQPLHLARAFH
jgi:hypothetical protein